MSAGIANIWNFHWLIRTYARELSLGAHRVDIKERTQDYSDWVSCGCAYYV